MAVAWQKAVCCRCLNFSSSCAEVWAVGRSGSPGVSILGILHVNSSSDLGMASLYRWETDGLVAGWGVGYTGQFLCQLS